MEIPDSFYHWVTRQNSNLLLVGIITFLFPKIFIQSIYNCNRKRQLWGGKKACLTISFDCDYPQDVEAFPSLLKILSKYAFKTSFACVGNWIEKYPDEHKMILDQGHEILNHTYSHPDNEILNPGRKFRDISRIEKKEEIEKCHEICDKVLKYEPIGCRIPHFKNLFTDEIYGILKELGYLYSSSTWVTGTKSFGMPFEAEGGILEFPLTTCPKHPFTVFDTWHSLNSPRLSHRIIHRTEDAYYDLFKQLIDMGIETNSYLNIYIDPYDVLKMEEFSFMFDYISHKKEDLIVLPYIDIVTQIKDCT